MTAEPPAIALAAPSLRDEAVQAAVLKLVEAFAFKEAEAVLATYREETEQKQSPWIEGVLLNNFYFTPPR